MNKLFKPTYVVKNINELDFSSDIFKDVETLILDADNTLVPYYEKNSDEILISFLKDLKEKGFKVIIMSNNFRKEGLYKDCLSLDIKYYSFSLKPLKLTYLKVIKENNINPLKTIQIGDQILTDVVGANRCKIKNIYVEPIIDSDNIFTILNRKIEKKIKRELGI